VSWYQKDKTNLDFTEARDSERQWHQLGRMQVCTLLQADTMPATHHSVFYRADALPVAQPTVSQHCRDKALKEYIQITKQTELNSDHTRNLLITNKSNTRQKISYDKLQPRMFVIDNKNLKRH